MATDAGRFDPVNVGRRLLSSPYLVLGLSLAYFLALVPFTPGFSSPENLRNLLLTLLPLWVAAAGQTLVLVGGGIDLSITSTMALASVTGALVMNDQTGWLRQSAWAAPAGVGVMLATGAAIGALNGLAVAVARMPAFIVTLTTMMWVSGLAIWLTKSASIAGLPPAFNALGGHWLSTGFVALLVAGAAQALLGRTIAGRWLQAVGHNPKTALISGVPVRRVQLASYVASGLCAAVAAILYTGQQETGSPVLGQRLLLDIVGATVLGGTSLFGGRGHVLWTLSGVIFIKLIDNSLNLLNLSLFAITMVKGAVILLAALLDSARVRLAELE